MAERAPLGVKHRRKKEVRGPERLRKACYFYTGPHLMYIHGTYTWSKDSLAQRTAAYAQKASLYCCVREMEQGIP